jgi:DNA modification methylase
MGSMNSGVKSIGIELNKSYCSLAKKRIKRFQKDLFNKKKTYEPKVICDDSINLLKYIKKESVDLAITSPPYWNILNQKRTADYKEIRNYSKSKKDLGNIDDYEKFLQSLKQVFSKVYDSLKINKRCISIVMDIRKKDKFYSLHEDQTRIMKEIGFELEEYVIWDRQIDYNNMKTLGYPYVFRFNKVHEFICIYWKR